MSYELADGSISEPQASVIDCIKISPLGRQKLMLQIVRPAMFIEPTLPTPSCSCQYLSIFAVSMGKMSIHHVEVEEVVRTPMPINPIDRMINYLSRIRHSSSGLREVTAINHLMELTRQSSSLGDPGMGADGNSSIAGQG
jgi:hypothetical protein